MNGAIRPISWRLRTRTVDTADHTLLMGILNVTPDSFSDGGRFSDPNEAVARGWELWNEGADIVDVGGESTRPGAGAVPEDEELARVVPVVAGLSARGVTVSIDTSKPAVAAAAIEHGAEIVNDVTALATPGMEQVVADSGAGVVLMHLRGDPRTMQEDPHYEDVVGEVGEFLLDRADFATAAGIAVDRICIDPGIGFGKTLRHNLELLRNIGWFAAGRYPVLVGASRKSFIAGILPGTAPPERDEATGATVALGIAFGAAVIRVHDVSAARAVGRVADAIVRA